MQHGSRGALEGTGGERVTRPQRFAALAALCGTVVLAGWAATWLVGFGSLGIENTAAPIGDGGATRGATALSADAGPIDAPRATAMASVAAVATPHLEPSAPSVVVAA